MPLPDFSYKKVVNVADYGATGLNTQDATPYITAALNDIISHYGAWATTNSNGPVTVAIPNEYVLYFPPGQYILTSRIIMTDQLYGLTIIGDNAVIMPGANAVFQNEGGAEDFAFQHTYCYNFKMIGLNFAGFNKAVQLVKSYTVDSGMIKISNCGFQNNDFALDLSYISGLAVIENSKFINNETAMQLQGDKIVVKECWISDKSNGMALATGTHLAPIINYGKLTMESCMLVPSGASADAVEPAWINNYASVTVKDTRQGGETGSFTLVNNFAGVGDLLTGQVEPNAVIIRDSQCYAVFGNTDTYRQPAILRYVAAIPNVTIIEDNRGMLQAQLVDFSKYLYNGDSTAIQNMIQASGAANVISNFNVVVKVSDNAGGFGNGTTGSLIPDVLFPFVRDVNYLWPYKPTINLPLLAHTTDSTTGAQLFTFQYPADFKALMINFSADPWTAGSSAYSGGYVGILKSNGFWSNSEGSGPVKEALDIVSLFDYIGDSDPSSWPGGAFVVDAYWEATGDRFLPYSVDANRNFIIRVSGSDGLQDQITVAPIDAVLHGINNNFVS